MIQIKHEITASNDENNHECTTVSDVWGLVKPRDTTKKNFFYSFDNAKDAIEAAQRGEIPRKGVSEFIKYGKILQETSLVEFFEQQRACDNDDGEGTEDSDCEDVDQDDRYKCFACGQLSIMPRCCRQHWSPPFCFDLQCVLSRKWHEIHTIIRREWCDFYGDTDPLTFEGELIMEKPSQASPSDYGDFALDKCIDVNDDEYAY